jgi:hypothetical protein
MSREFVFTFVFVLLVAHGQAATPSHLEKD